MPLKITLKPNEKMILGGAVIKNGLSSTTFYIENNALVLRERDIIHEDEADTPCKRLYLSIQLMYMDNKNLAAYYEQFWRNAGELAEAVVTMRPLVDEMCKHVIAENYYNALKTVKKMIVYEKELLDHATRRAQCI